MNDIAPLSTVQPTTGRKVKRPEATWVIRSYHPELTPAERDQFLREAAAIVLSYRLRKAI